MLKANPVKPDEQSMQNAIGSFLRIGALVLILYYSMQILAPFVKSRIVGDRACGRPASDARVAGSSFG